MAFTWSFLGMDTRAGRLSGPRFQCVVGTAPHLTPPAIVPPWQGHAAPILYAVWAEAGFLPEAELLNLRKVSSDLDGHPVPVSAPHQEPHRPLSPLPASRGLLEGGWGCPLKNRGY